MDLRKLELHQLERGLLLDRSIKLSPLEWGYEKQRDLMTQVTLKRLGEGVADTVLDECDHCPSIFRAEVEGAEGTLLLVALSDEGHGTLWLLRVVEIE